MRFEQSDYKRETEHMDGVQQWETLDDWPVVEGYDFEKDFVFDDFLASYASTGIQASNLARAIDIVKRMRSDNATVFLSCTANMISSGCREIIRYLVKHKHVHCLVMSAGGVEEDVIKTLKPFVLGRFDVPGRMLFGKGIGRIGNIFAPYDRYLHFEKFMQPFFDRIYEAQKRRERPHTPSEFIRELGMAVNHEDSVLYWAAKNGIPVFCPAFTDGGIGDLLHFQRMKRDDLYVDVVGDHHNLVKFVLDQERTGAIILGGGAQKHYVLNANIFREGLDYAVYITTAVEHDASDSGGNPEEAITWAKIRQDGQAVKVWCEASIAFPLLVAGTFRE